MWCAMSEYDDANTSRTNKKTTCSFTCQVSRFMCYVLALVFHVVIGVGRLIFRFHHAYVIPSFLLDVVVRLGLVIVNSDCSHNSCMLHIAKTGPLRCCPYRNCLLGTRKTEKQKTNEEVCPPVFGLVALWGVPEVPVA